MNKFHTTLSRRDFMKGLGLAGAGLGAAAATAPVFHDLDEALAASDASDVPRPWYVREVDEPTVVEVDWSQTQRYSENDTFRGTHSSAYLSTYLTPEQTAERKAFKAEQELKWLKEGRAGWALKDRAFSGNVGRAGVKQTFDGVGGTVSIAKTPDQLSAGLPKWTGTPEEANKILRLFMRFVGAMSIGFVELDTNTTEKLTYSTERGGKIRNSIEDVAGGVPFVRDLGNGYKDHVIPKSMRTCIAYLNQESQESFKVNPTRLMAQIRYRRNANIQQQTIQFIRSLGYQAVAQFAINALYISPAMTALAGRGEIGRINRVISPEYGPTVGSFVMATDFPVAYTKPIDAGMARFCLTCKKCAEHCEEGALTHGDPTWDEKENATPMIIPAPSGTRVAGWHNPGHKAFFEDSRKCTAYRSLPESCTSGKCLAVCTFTKNHISVIHEVTSMTLSTTSIFNRFLRLADDWAGYGTKDPAKFWDIKHPVFGVDSTIAGGPDWHGHNVR